MTHVFKGEGFLTVVANDRATLLGKGFCCAVLFRDVFPNWIIWPLLFRFFFFFTVWNIICFLFSNRHNTVFLFSLKVIVLFFLIFYFDFNFNKFHSFSLFSFRTMSLKVIIFT